MKTKLIRIGSLPLVLTCILFIAAACPAADDLQIAFDQGRTAYYQGNFELAKALLTKVQAAHPDHMQTRIMLANIAAQPKQDLSLKGQYAAVKIPKIEFNEVTLSESLQALALMAKNATNGKVSPNFIVKNPDLNKSPITLSLSNAPLDEVVRYLADLTKAKVSWDKHAVVFLGIAD